ncbi:ABC transporter ATP-binding protein [Halosquirtibacter xylanolyticus]|uniref:ABC transporter ATP-binding protein n=1 Tax=Halosquirtibacter xylanolyticus TaxID=3374599 RepID=UPI00374930C4|nr:ABC transporter ATP-binding protein [Prolixibacteraceae bacterium]
MKKKVQNNYVIEVSNLCKKFGAFYANKNLSFDVKRGEIFGFLGANGAGKTTAMKIISGLQSPTSGEVHVLDYDVYHEAEKIKKEIGYMSQKFSLYEDLSVWENLRFFAGIYGLSRKTIKEKGEKILHHLDLWEHRKELVRDIPLGWKQKLAFSLATIHDPKIVFLDEPTGGVDPYVRRVFWDQIYQAQAKGITIFVTTHYMDEAEYCDRICILSQGEVVAYGAPEKLKKEHQVDSIDQLFVLLARNVE